MKKVTYNCPYNLKPLVWDQYSPLLQYEILEKLMKCIYQSTDCGTQNGFYTLYRKPPLTHWCLLTSLKFRKNTLDISPKSELHSRTAPSVVAHHHSVGPDTGRNSGGRRIIKKAKWRNKLFMFFLIISIFTKVFSIKSSKKLFWIKVLTKFTPT